MTTVNTSFFIKVPCDFNKTHGTLAHIMRIINPVEYVYGMWVELQKSFILLLLFHLDYR